MSAIKALRRYLTFAATITAALPTAVPIVWANEPTWPTRPLRIVVAGGPASVTDIRARWLAERLTRAIGQPVVVENKPGAGGNIGTEHAARSAPDGYTLVLVHQGTMAINPHLYGRLGYDPLADFAPVTRFGHGSLVLTVHPSVPATSVAELIALAKARPGALSYGSPGIGTPPHLASELFKRAADINAIHVAYKGGGALAAALLGGQITWSMDGVTAQVPHIRSGRLRALAVSGATRVAALPEVPTIAESGLPGFDYAGWTGIAVPAATPKPVIARLHTEITKTMASAEGRDWFASIGTEPGAMTPEAFGAFIRAEHAKWGKVVREAGIKAE